MKNAIIINGTTYELVPNDTGKDVCDTCDLRDICFDCINYALCVLIHSDEYEYHYVKRQKGGDA